MSSTVLGMADKAPTSTAVYTAQIVIMEESYVREALDAVREEFGLDRSALARRCLRAGLPLVTAELRTERDAIVKAATVGS